MKDQVHRLYSPGNGYCAGAVHTAVGGEPVVPVENPVLLHLQDAKEECQPVGKLFGVGGESLTAQTTCIGKVGHLPSGQ